MLEHTKRAISNSKVSPREIKELSCKLHKELRKHVPPRRPYIHAIDELAAALLPDDTEKTYRAVDVPGNGNCLYNCASIFLSGNTSCSTVLRALAALELHEKADNYAQHQILSKTLEEGQVFTEHADTLFSLLLTEEPSDYFDICRDRSAAIRKEAELTCEDQRWSAMIHILALASVLKIPIQSVYPNANQGLRPLFHRRIDPLQMDSDSRLSSSDIGILWSRAGNLDNRSGFSFEPNHFVLLLPELKECSETPQTKTCSPETPMEVNEDDKKERSDSHFSNESKTASSVVDVGELLEGESGRVISDQERFAFLNNHFVPDQNYAHLTKQTLTKGKMQQRYTLTFQTSWFVKYPWLVFSPCLRGGLCKFCILFPPKTDRIKNAVLVNRPLVNLTKATGKKGSFETHASCNYHKEAVQRGIYFIENYTQPAKGIQYKILETNKKSLENNKHILGCMMKAIHLCGKQGIALRGHRDDYTSESENKGNFMAVFNLLAESDGVLRRHLSDSKRNAKYTSKTVQNEMIQLMGDFIRDEATKDLRDGDALFSLIADEVTDISNKEILSLCVRFVSSSPNIQIQEIFLDFVSLEGITGELITKAIIETLKKHRIDITKCRGQCYDGASSMSSEKVGVQCRIREYSETAFYTHCNSHVLNLSVAASCKLPSVRNMVDSINEIYLFFSNSPKRQRVFEAFIEHSTLSSKAKKLKGLCKTRWVERHLCFDTMYELFGAICSTYEQFWIRNR